MPKAKINDINLCYRDHGKGQPLIIITGFASTQNTFYLLSRALSRQYRVVTFDNIGFGGSDKPPGPYSAKERSGRFKKEVLGFLKNDV